MITTDPRVHGSVTWTYNTLPNYLHQTGDTNGKGIWHLSHPGRSDKTRIVDVKFQPPYKEGESEQTYCEQLMDKNKRTADFERLATCFSPTLEQGYFETAEDAYVIIDQIMNDVGPENEENPDGFEFQNRNKYHNYHKPVKTGSFDIVVHDHNIRVIFQGNSSRYWQNVMSLDFHLLRHRDNTVIRPCFWPEPLQDRFNGVAMRAAITMVNRYIESNRIRHLGRLAFNKKQDWIKT